MSSPDSPLVFLARVTVKTHANRAMAKLGARAQLVVIAFTTGRVTAPRSGVGPLFAARPTSHPGGRLPAASARSR